MPLRVKLPTSATVATWRAPLWQRLFFPALGVVCIAGGVWPYAGEPYEPIWITVAVGVVMIAYALRPKLVLFEDALYIRGHLLSRLISIHEISAVAGSPDGLDVWWGDGHMSEASAIGEEGLWAELPGSDGRRHDMKSLILGTRDAYLAQHGLSARPDPAVEDERRRREYKERGWVEHNPPLKRPRDRDQA